MSHRAENFRKAAAMKRAGVLARPPWKCGQCGAERPAYAWQQKQKYCSKACMSIAYRDIKRGPGNPHYSNAGARVCEHCRGEYQSYQKTSKFCSRDCQSAGMNKYAPRKDHNHNEIMKAMKEHCQVLDTSHVGRGFPDGLAFTAEGNWQFFDIKNPKTAYGKKGLSERQKRWVSEFKHRMVVFLIYTVEEAIKLAKGDLDGLKFEHPGSEGFNES